MTRAKQVLTKLAFHAKMHKALSYAHEYAARDTKRKEDVVLSETERKVQEGMLSAAHVLDKKTLQGKKTSTIKELVSELRQEFDSMKKERKKL